MPRRAARARRATLTLRSYRNTGRRPARGPQRVPNVALREDKLHKQTHQTAQTFKPPEPPVLTLKIQGTNPRSISHRPTTKRSYSHTPARMTEANLMVTFHRATMNKGLTASIRNEGTQLDRTQTWENDHRTRRETRRRKYATSLSRNANGNKII